jgi:ABC-type amino acid transport substrate-binding protein
VKILLFFSFVFISFAQTITVLTGNEKDKFTNFEKEMCSLFIDTYNKNKKLEFKLQFIPSTFSNILNKLAKPDSNALIFAIYTLSITEDRKEIYDFSTPYMINRPMILKSKLKMTQKDESDTRAVFGVFKNNMYEPILIERVKQTKQVYRSFLAKTKIVDALNSGVIDFWYTDYADLWSYNLEVANELNIGTQDQYGLMFPKNSLLNKQLSKTFILFLKSDEFYKLVFKHFGKAAVNYFQRGLKRTF